jgi:hypothetical protein
MGYETSMKAQDLNTDQEAAMCLTLQDEQFGEPLKTKSELGMGGA